MRDDLRMSAAADPDEAREAFERKVGAFVGRQVLDLDYWDIHNFGPEPRTWDYGDWHQAVMGVEFKTDKGPVSVVWTDTFFPFGVEVFAEPISRHLRLGDEGPEGWAVGNHEFWHARRASPVRRAATFWEQISVGPSVRSSDQAVVGEPQTFSVPVAMRLDFDQGPVWMVAGMPQWPDVDKVFVPGDEVMVVFSADRMRRIGFPESDFIA